MDNDYQLDLDELLRVIRATDVMLFRFVVISQRLLLDSRYSESEGPMLKVVQRTGGARQRFRELKELRPRFPVPERLTAVAWPRFVESLVSTGVWAVVEERLVRSGDPSAVERARAALQELQTLERAEIRNAIRGEGYRSLWERQS